MTRGYQASTKHQLGMNEVYSKRNMLPRSMMTLQRAFVVHTTSPRQGIHTVRDQSRFYQRLEDGGSLTVFAMVSWNGSCIITRYMYRLLIRQHLSSRRASVCSGRARGRIQRSIGVEVQNLTSEPPHEAKYIRTITLPPSCQRQWGFLSARAESPRT